MMSLSAFGIKVMLASQNELGTVPSSSVFLEVFERIGVNSSHVG